MQMTKLKRVLVLGAFTAAIGVASFAVEDEVSAQAGAGAPATAGKPSTGGGTTTPTGTGGTGSTSTGSSGSTSTSSSDSGEKKSGGCSLAAPAAPNGSSSWAAFGVMGLAALAFRR